MRKGGCGPANAAFDLKRCRTETNDFPHTSEGHTSRKPRLERMCFHSHKGHTCTLHGRSNTGKLMGLSEMVQRPYASFPTQTLYKRLMLVVPGGCGPAPSSAGEMRILPAALRMRSEPWTRPYHRAPRATWSCGSRCLPLTPVNTRRQLNLTGPT